jgi:hypothetical protein
MLIRRTKERKGAMEPREIKGREIAAKLSLVREAILGTYHRNPTGRTPKTKQQTNLDMKVPKQTKTGG